MGPGVKSPEARMWRLTAISTVLIALALFLSAGTVVYWQAWVYLVLVVLTAIPLIRLITNDPILRENRMRAGPRAEQRPIQKLILWLAAIPLIALYIVPGLDRRFGWSSVPAWLSIVGCVLIVASMWLVYRVFQENSFGSATVEVAKDQKVISTGPYAFVRHPMYSGAALYFIGLALVLGSYWALIPSALGILGLVWRLFDEEAFLRQNLPGYAAYCATVRWRLWPGVF